jgi:hypothetical protein
MAKTFRLWDVDQGWLLPTSVHEFVPPGHLAHFVPDTVREALDLSAILGTYTEERGFPPYHPGMTVALLLYGYSISSSRQLARACEERGRFLRDIAHSSCGQGGGAWGLAARKLHIPNRDRPAASPLSSPQQPVDHVCRRGMDHQLETGRSPPRPIIEGRCFSAYRRSAPIRDGLPEKTVPKPSFW